MPKPHPMSPYFSRRRWLMTVGAAAGWPLVAPLLGCGVASINAAGDAGTNAGTGQPSTGQPSTTQPDTGNQPATTQPGPTADGIDASKWAVGGTVLLAKKYADPLGSTDGTECALTCQTAEGTCADTSGNANERDDIAEGQQGLPMAVVLRVLDSDCQPIENVSVNLWHTSPQGLYSGQTISPSYCCNNNADAQAAGYFRGMQKTNDDGEVTFRSCFPGWTANRAVHVNLELIRAGRPYLTTQLLFNDITANGVFTVHPLYKGRGPAAVTNAQDPVVAASQTAAYSLDARQMPDGCMLAYKTLILRDRTSQNLCTVPVSAAAANQAANGNTLMQ